MGFFDRFKSKFERAIHERRAKKVTAEPSVKKEELPALAEGTAGARRGSQRAARTLIAPLVTEKTATLAEHGTYVFVVRRAATKPEVKAAVHDVYGVMPTAVRIITMQGKAIRFGRTSGRRKDWKKAIVTMPVGKTLPIYE